ncbi:hypothetical protein SAMN06295912_102233 [Sphingomonas laterariae]|uniref:Uncharacterized protein n=1 Tax=Edaphosphingomonas laterariae TaxID=861865 RepID=A0A239CJB0_9SPHN|nr:hypothetical protein [Sphingomonas laterariae]SNS19982.1 hypothetical protein SAMN06295912_102233 [Sphingomonas laterariae]
MVTDHNAGMDGLQEYQRRFFELATSDDAAIRRFAFIGARRGDARRFYQVEQLRIDATVLGLSLETFQGIVERVNDRAKISATWGTFGDRLAAIREEIFAVADNKKGAGFPTP